MRPRDRQLTRPFQVRTQHTFGSASKLIAAPASYTPASHSARPGPPRPPPGLVDICIITSPTCGIDDAKQTLTPADSRQTRRQVGLLWAIRQALVVAAVYVATSSAGTSGTLFWALAGSAAGLYLVSYLLLGQRLGDLEEDKGLGPTQPENLVYLLSYLSLVRPLTPPS